MKTTCQHLTMKQYNELLKLLQKSEGFFDGKLGTWKKYPVDFELKEDAKPICSRPYPVPKVREEMFKKIGLTSSSTRSLQVRTWFKMGSPILCSI